MKSNFKIIKKDTKTKARLGILNTPHGKVNTPSYVIVATYGQIRHLKPADIKKTKTQIVICNTYHLWDKAFKIEKLKFKIRGVLGVKMPVMTDSGGFQVFSLAFGGKNKVGKILNLQSSQDRIFGLAMTKYSRKNIRITKNGVYFKLNGKKKFLGPELSIKIQEKLGADMIFAFDECASPLDDYDYNVKALKRTNEWALRCLRASKNKNQMLFGIVQGGKYKSLRIKSAKFIGSLPFEGFGIGGSFGKEEMPQTLKWVIPHLPDEKPRHLLGVGRIEDIFRAIENGVDLFDCVIPTREARHGRLWTRSGKIDIRKGKYLKDGAIIEKGCKCSTCSKKISKSEIRQLFKSQKETDKTSGQKYALLHNIWFFNDVLEEIRESIKNNKFTEYKTRFLKKFKM